VSRRVVVGGALLSAGRLLAARRTAPAALAGRWEFPGGKVEPGESEPDALVRELREELGVRVSPGGRVPGEWDLGGDFVLRVWTAAIVSGVPSALQDHDELRWVTPAEAAELDWRAPDRPALAWVGRALREDRPTA
jgi:8-oxo-dGTP diphosphatase